MIHVAIVEDSERERKHLKECLAFLAAQEQVQFHISEFSDGMKLIGSYQPVWDIIFLDIEMPGMNGMEIAREIREKDNAVILIFVTAMAQYAVQGYDVDAMCFMVKPVNPYDFAMKTVRALNRCMRRQEDSVEIRTERERITVRTADIRYLEILGHHVVYHTNVGDFSEYGTLKEAERKINRSHFVRCNRCYLVNLCYVEEIKNDTVWIGKDGLAISRPQKKEFISAFSRFIGGI